MADALVLAGISKSFGGIHALRDVSITVARGQTHGLIGPNGAGKTTAVNIASGLYRPTEGAVILGGRDITGLRTHQRARLGLARTYQAARLFDELTVEQNVRIMLEAGRRPVTRSRIHAVLGLVDLVKERKEGAGDLPHGKRKILEVACAIGRDPDVLLLDEPAAGLDVREVDVLTGLLEESKETAGVLFIDHNIELVGALCDSVTVMASGAVLAHGEPAEVMRNSAVVAAYVGEAI